MTIDSTDQRFGSLTAKRVVGRERGALVWACTCDCSRPECPGVVEVVGTRLRNGLSQSCASVTGILRKPYPRPSKFVTFDASCRQALRINAQRNAAKRGLVWSVSDSEYDAMFSQRCHWCGSVPVGNYVRQVGPNPGRVFRYNGVDRVDNSRGYESDNIVPCCKTCNRAKNDMALDEWWTYLDNLIQFRARASDATTSALAAVRASS